MLFRILAVLSYFVNSQGNCSNYTSNQCLFTFDEVSCSFSFCAYLPQNQTIFSQNWQTCVSYCCSTPTDSIPESATSLTQSCSSVAGDDELSAAQLGAMIVIALFIPLCIYCFIVKKQGKYCPCLKGNNETGGIIISEISENEAIKRLGTDSFCENDKNVLAWKEDTSKRSSIVKICSICFENSPNVQTDCGHQFHLVCLCCWFKRSRSCPDCRAILAKVKIHCEKCFESRIISSLSMDRRELGQCRQCSTY